MERRSLSEIFVHFKSWVALAALTLCCVGVAVLPAAADASIFQVPNVDIHQVPQFYIGWTNNPLAEFISGVGFDDKQNWSLVFETTPPGSPSEDCPFSGWCTIRRTYTNGNFTLSGPNGLEFNADIVSGWAVLKVDYELFRYELGYELFGYGNWNDSTHQFNTFLLTGYETDDYPGGLHLLLATPEPSSLVLLGSGIVGLAGMLRRKLM